MITPELEDLELRGGPEDLPGKGTELIAGDLEPVELVKITEMITVQAQKCIITECQFLQLEETLEERMREIRMKISPNGQFLEVFKLSQRGSIDVIPLQASKEMQFNQLVILKPHPGIRGLEGGVIPK